MGDIFSDLELARHTLKLISNVSVTVTCRYNTFHRLVALHQARELAVTDPDEWLKRIYYYFDSMEMSQLQKEKLKQAIKDNSNVSFQVNCLIHGWFISVPMHDNSSTASILLHALYALKSKVLIFEERYLPKGVS